MKIDPIKTIKSKAKEYIDSSTGFYSAATHKIHLPKSIPDYMRPITGVHEAYHRAIGESLYFYIVGDIYQILTTLMAAIDINRSLIITKLADENLNAEELVQFAINNTLMIDDHIIDDESLIKKMQFYHELYVKYRILMAHCDCVQEGTATFLSINDFFVDDEFDDDYFKLFPVYDDQHAKAKAKIELQTMRNRLLSEEIDDIYHLGYSVTKSLSDMWGYEQLLPLALIACTTPYLEYDLIDLNMDDFQKLTASPIYHPDKKWISLLHVNAESMQKILKAIESGEISRIDRLLNFSSLDEFKISPPIHSMDEFINTRLFSSERIISLFPELSDITSNLPRGKRGEVKKRNTQYTIADRVVEEELKMLFNTIHFIIERKFNGS